MKSNVIISLRNVWKTYEIGKIKVHALRGLTLDVSKGEFLSIMGPSGSGKSTAMNMVGCLDTPSQGEIFLDGLNIAAMTESELAQVRGRKIGFIFQQFNLINSLTAMENIMLPMTFQSIPTAKRMDKAKELLTLVGLGDRLNHRPTELSGGQQQRVAIARALSLDPEVILADEPTGNLDSKMSLSVMDFLTDLHNKKGTTIVMVTHDEDVAKAADRIEYLQDGKIIDKKTKVKK